jgi:hypothetical protein
MLLKQGHKEGQKEFSRTTLQSLEEKQLSKAWKKKLWRG